jgi:hypothetical protein
MLKSRIAIATALTSLAVCAVHVQGAEDDPPTPAPVQSDSDSRAITGTVLSTSNASGHTYVQIDTDAGIVWAAVPRTEIQEGDLVLLPSAYPMAQFYSPSLERRFDVIYFAPSVQVRGRGGAALRDP